MQRFIHELHVLHAIRLSVLATDAAGTIVFANEAAAVAFGADAEELIGRDAGRLLIAADDPTQGEAMVATVLAGESWRGDLIVRKADGTTFVADVSATPIRYDDSIVGSVIVADDMTEIRKAEETAAGSRQRLQLAHDAAQLGSWHWNMLDGSNVWDEKLEAIFGLPPGGFDGTFEGWAALIHPDDIENVMAIVQEAMDKRSSYVLRNRCVWPDGTVHWVEAHGKVTTDGRGVATGTIGCVRDITDRVTVQEREADAQARALLLQQVTAEFAEAWTPAQVATVLSASLERVREIVGTDVQLVVPDSLNGISGSDVFIPHADSSLSREDEQFLDTLASQCAIAAQRAELLERTSDIAEQLQSSLAASPLPDLERFELAVHYAPGGDALEHVGGDWYDAVSTGDGSLALVVGDVMGRGVRAATTMIRVRAGIRGLLTVNPLPQAVLTAADDMTARDAPDQFVTATAVLIDPADGTLSLCNAGHVPVIVVHPDGRTEALGGGSGAPLGVVEGLERDVATTRLERGAVVVLVTDGVVESRDYDLDIGMEKLVLTATEQRERPLEELVANLATLADDAMHDDVTVVAARYV